MSTFPNKWGIYGSQCYGLFCTVPRVPSLITIIMWSVIYLGIFPCKLLDQGVVYI